MCNRREGYLDGLEAHDILVDEELIRYRNYKEDDGFRYMERLIRNRDVNPFTAVYVTSEKVSEQILLKSSLVEGESVKRLN